MKKSLLFLFFCITFYTNAQRSPHLFTDELLLTGTQTKDFWTKKPIKDRYNEPHDSDRVFHIRHGFYQFVKNPRNKTLCKAIINPLIILDGYDPGDKRKIKHIKDIVNNRRKDENIKRLQDLGFDLFFLNFGEVKIGLFDYQDYPWWQFWRHSVNIMRDGGTDFIMNNASVLRKLIIMINEHNDEIISIVNPYHQHRPNFSEIKIIAPSMGGLITRLALRKMELDYEKHNVDLFVSFDSPHLGATVPLGIQKFFTNKSPAFEIAKFSFPILKHLSKIFNTPAAKQMLIRHLDPDSKSYRTNFNKQLKWFPLPLNSRNIALINGSLSGKPNKLKDDLKKKLVDFKLDLDWNLFGYKTNFLNVKMEAFEDTADSKIFTRSEEFVADNSTTHDTFLTKTKFKEEESLDYVAGSYLDWKNDLKGVLGEYIPFPFDKKEIKFTEKKGHKDYKLYEPLMKAIIKDGFIAWIPKCFRDLGLLLLEKVLQVSLKLTFNIQRTSFIPSKSALLFNIKDKNKPDLNEDISTRDLVCTGETPFDAYYANDKNEEHITLSPDMMDWLEKELQGIHQQSVSGGEIKGKRCKRRIRSTIANDSPPIDDDFTVEGFKMDDRKYITKTKTILIDKTSLLTIYPNPNNGLFNIKSANNMLFYSINNVFGKEIMFKKTNNKELSIDISKFSAGIYLLKLQMENGKIINKKILKR